MSKGTKLVTYAARLNAHPANNSSDKNSGKEERVVHDYDRSDYFHATEENLAAVVPTKLVLGRNPRIPVSAPMSAKKLQIVRRRMGLLGK